MAPPSVARVLETALYADDLDGLVAFYRDVIGLRLRSQHEDKVAFLGAREDASHEIALFALPADAPGPESNRVGMYHMAWEMPSFEDLEAFHGRLVANEARITGYSGALIDGDDHAAGSSSRRPAPSEHRQRRRTTAGGKGLRAGRSGNRECST